MNAPSKDSTEWISRNPLHLKIEHRAMNSTGMVFVYKSLWLGYIEPTNDVVKNATQWVQLVFVVDAGLEEANDRESIIVAFNTLDVEKVLKEAMDHERASLRLAEAHVNSAKAQLRRLEVLVARRIRDGKVIRL